jgi:hypothetical protein
MFLKVIKEILDVIYKIIWIAVVLIVLATIGKYFFLQNNTKNNLSQKKQEIPITIDWKKVNDDIVNAVRDAEGKANNYAEKELENFNSELKERVDKDFLPWYFSYWTQQKLGLLALYHAALHKFIEEHPGAAEAITREIQEEFAKRVLKPEISQMELEQISRNSLKIFLVSLSEDLSKIPKTYNIPQGDWDRYLSSISVMISDVEGGRGVPLSLKAITTASIGGGAILMKYLAPKISKATVVVADKVAAKTGSKLALKISEKMGAKVASKFAGKFLGAIAGVGIILWDLWDHYEVKKVNEPILRENLYEYIDLMTKELLENTRKGVLSPVYQVEEQIVKTVGKRE